MKELLEIISYCMTKAHFSKNPSDFVFWRSRVNALETMLETQIKANS